mmetsp:Transcript_14062/g.21915  ORF Transcript_14062/g.21915 Transcript_14062/m.21915 type:complete len:222 (-) Transcript_14062:454-1119(-)
MLLAIGEVLLLDLDGLEDAHVGDLLQRHGVHEYDGGVLLLLAGLDAADEVKVALLTKRLSHLLYLLGLRGELVGKVLWNQGLGEFVHELLDLKAELPPNCFRSNGPSTAVTRVFRFFFLDFEACLHGVDLTDERVSTFEQQLVERWAHHVGVPFDEILGVVDNVLGGVADGKLYGILLLLEDLGVGFVVLHDVIVHVLHSLVHVVVPECPLATICDYVKDS